MRALLDTHAFLWWVTDDTRLSSPARSIIVDPGNVLFLSAASAWEIVIKVRLRKLTLPDVPERYIPSRLEMNRFESLPIQMVHALQVTNLPDLHQDPFDRIPSKSGCLIAPKEQSDLGTLLRYLYRGGKTARAVLTAVNISNHSFYCFTTTNTFLSRYFG